MTRYELSENLGLQEFTTDRCHADQRRVAVAANPSGADDTDEVPGSRLFDDAPREAGRR